MRIRELWHRASPGIVRSEKRGFRGSYLELSWLVVHPQLLVLVLNDELPTEMDVFERSPTRLGFQYSSHAFDESFRILQIGSLTSGISSHSPGDMQLARLHNLDSDTCCAAKHTISCPLRLNGPAVHLLAMLRSL